MTLKILYIKKWKIKECCACDVCGVPQTIEHLLYDCVYVKPLWCLVDEVCIDNITFKKILELTSVFTIITLYQYLAF